MNHVRSTALINKATHEPNRAPRNCTLCPRTMEKASRGKVQFRESSENIRLSSGLALTNMDVNCIWECERIHAFKLTLARLKSRNRVTLRLPWCSLRLCRGHSRHSEGLMRKDKCSHPGSIDYPDIDHSCQDTSLGPQSDKYL